MTDKSHQQTQPMNRGEMQRPLSGYPLRETQQFPDKYQHNIIQPDNDIRQRMQQSQFMDRPQDPLQRGPTLMVQGNVDKYPVRDQGIEYQRSPQSMNQQRFERLPVDRQFMQRPDIEIGRPGDRVPMNRIQGERNYVERPGIDRFQYERQFVERPGMDRQFQERPQMHMYRPYLDRPPMDRPLLDRPTVNRFEQDKRERSPLDRNDDRQNCQTGIPMDRQIYEMQQFQRHTMDRQDRLLPMERYPVDKHFIDKPPLDRPYIPPMDRSPMDRPPMDRVPMDRLPMNIPSMDRPPMDRPPMNRPPMDRLPMDRPPMDRPPMDRPPMDRPPMDRPPMDRPQMDRPSIYMDRQQMNRPPMGIYQMDRHPMDRQQMDRQQMNRQQMDRQDRTQYDYQQYQKVPIDSQPYDHRPDYCHLDDRQAYNPHHQVPYHPSHSFHPEDPRYHPPHSFHPDDPRIPEKLRSYPTYERYPGISPENRFQSNQKPDLCGYPNRLPPEMPQKYMTQGPRSEIKKRYHDDFDLGLQRDASDVWRPQVAQREKFNRDEVQRTYGARQIYDELDFEARQHMERVQDDQFRKQVQGYQGNRDVRTGGMTQEEARRAQDMRSSMMADYRMPLNSIQNQYARRPVGDMPMKTPTKFDQNCNQYDENLNLHELKGPKKYFEARYQNYQQ